MADTRTSEQVSEQASFTKDLGLDSLDAVEVVMAIEGELSVQPPPRSLSPSAQRHRLRFANPHSKPDPWSPHRQTSTCSLTLSASSRMLYYHIAEEFSIEIPDEEADRITTIGEGGFQVQGLETQSSPSSSTSSSPPSSSTAIDYISKSPEAH